ncbi:venom peptide SjAPI-like [Pyxicephalus adspersus]|uniref:venom peptide SjAPI-like n=1 Tax=Pyxicephalus adspersus TaxID=30357 RepID=UPI003B593A24
MKVGAILLLWGFVICASFIREGSSYPFPQKVPCNENEEYVTCGIPCIVTCANRANPPTFCMSSCFVGCTCKSGFMYNSAKKCVRPEECS